MTVVHSTRNCRNWCRWSNALWLAWNSDRLTIIPCTRHALKIFEPAFNVFHPPRRLLPLDQRATFAPLESDTSVEFHPINAQLQSKPSSRECYLRRVSRPGPRGAFPFLHTFNSLKAHPQIVSVWSRYHTLLALGFFLMESIGTKHFLLPLPLPYRPGVVLGPSFYANHVAVYSEPKRELLILLRINAVYGWSRKGISLNDCRTPSKLTFSLVVALTLFLFCAETVIGLVTTIISLLGGMKGLMGSTNILICGPGRVNVPDVNIASIYLGLVIHKTLDVVQDIEAMAGRPNPHSACFLKLFRTTLPTLHMCLRDTALYFILVFVALLVN
ncbi:hypothetical protein B0H14DRAFT_3168908, partial [Mycena olivaceomarginata]